MFNLIIGFVMDVIIFWGTAMGAAMAATVTETGTMEMPPTAVVLFALTVAIVQAGRRWDSKTSPSPIKEEAVVVRTPAQLETQAKVTEDTVAHVVEQVTARLKPPPVVLAEVTPQRVDITGAAKEPVSTQKDSS